MEKTRHELFDLAWSMPMTKLSKQFELSDVGLRKICVKHEIPLPPQGYWTSKQFGKEICRPTLPDKDFNPIIEINDDYKMQLNREQSEIKKATKKNALNPPNIELRKPEKLKHERCIATYKEIKEFVAELEKKPGVVKFDTVKDKFPISPPTHAFSFKYFRSSRNGIPIYATARNAIRAICIADEIFDRLQRKGIEIHFEFSERFGSEMYAVKERDRIQLRFREPYTKVSRTPALSKIEKQIHGYMWGSVKIEVPKNELWLIFGWKSYLHKSIRDSNLKLEYQLDRIVDYIVDDLNEKIEARRQSEIRARENERIKYISEYNQRIVKSQKNQLEHALKESTELENLIRIKVYLKTMKGIFSKLPAEEKAAGLTWIDLVKKELKTIQPIETRIKRIKYAAKKPTKNIREHWYADPLPKDHVPDFEAIYAEERKKYID